MLKPYAAAPLSTEKRAEEGNRGRFKGFSRKKGTIGAYPRVSTQSFWR